MKKEFQEKKRIDQLLVDKKIADSKQKAQALIMSGQVIVNDKPVTKSGVKVSSDSVIRVRGEQSPYVSRGGYKLAAAITEFKINAHEKTCLDIGASTGGFTQVLLNSGAAKVYALDVGHSQLDWKIRSDPKVIVIENENARYVTEEKIIERIDIIVMDVSFISVIKIIPHIKKNFSKENTKWVILIKPQFELNAESVSKGGIVQSEELRKKAVDDVVTQLKDIGLICKGLIESPIKGAKGNVEFLAYFN